MKRFLPTIPAFLFCFIGGWLIHPAVDPTRELAAMVFVPLNEIGGYQAWKTRMGDMEKRKIEVANAKKDAEKLKTEREMLEGLQAELEKLKPQIKKTAAQQNERKVIIATKEYVDLDQKRKALDELITLWATEKDKDFNARLQWSKEYELAKNNYEESLKVNAPKLKKLAGSAPP